MDFVINNDLEPKLIDIQGSPEFTTKNYKFVSNVLKLENEILNLRSSKIFGYLYTLKQQVY